VCDRAQLVNVAEMTFLTGVALGGLVSGIISDKYDLTSPQTIAISERDDYEQKIVINLTFSVSTQIRPQKDPDAVSVCANRVRHRDRLQPLV